MGKIVLQKENVESGFIDADSLTEVQAKTINMSCKLKEIFILGSDGEILPGGIETANIIEGNYVSVDDISAEENEDNEQLMPEILSVTIPDESSEEDEEEQEITVEDKEQAEILLSKNGNTVRATIKSLPLGSKSLSLLHACHELELNGRNRTGVLNSIQSKMMEC